jgi:putative phosphoesterase
MRRDPAMKVVVVSDTHLPRFVARLDEALRRVAAERPNLIVHCGDLTTLDAVERLATIAPVEAVAGNNDGPEIERRFGRRKIVAAGDLRIGVVHGDGERGTTLGRARAAFAGERLDAIAFGHSHIPYLALHDGTWVVNPGSPTDKRRQPRYSFAILERDASGTLRPRISFFPDEPIATPSSP